MPGPSKHQREHPSTYFVQDRSNREELKRLQMQDGLLTASMGGVLPEQPEPERFEDVLDVGCGTGGWLIEVAKTYPTIKRLVGVDVSETLIAYAREQAEKQQVADRVQFHTMDALRMLEFPTGSLDLVNQRLGVSYLRTWDWPGLLREYQRITRPGGMIRITEGNWMAEESTSPALTQLSALAMEAFLQAGHFFRADDGNVGIFHALPDLLQRHGIQQVQTRIHVREFRAGTLEGQLLREDVAHVFHTMIPFLQKWARLPADYEEIYQRMLQETLQPDFVARMRLVTAWGIRNPALTFGGKSR